MQISEAFAPTKDDGNLCRWELGAGSEESTAGNPKSPSGGAAQSAPATGYVDAFQYETEGLTISVFPWGHLLSLSRIDGVEFF